jgi:hypothetical protein
MPVTMGSETGQPKDRLGQEQEIEPAPTRGSRRNRQRRGDPARSTTMSSSRRQCRPASRAPSGKPSASAQ